MPQQRRKERISQPKGGWAGTSSTDFFHLADRLHRLAKSEAQSLDGNTSMYVWAALPMLLSGLCAFVVEREAMFRSQRHEHRVVRLQLPLPRRFERLYGVKAELLKHLRELAELRNEIIHPAHLATGTHDNWPDELRDIKECGLLSSTGDPQSDYLMLDQMKSPRLLEWASEVVGRLKDVVVQYHGTGVSS